jgi:alkylated DNA repair protein alkB family protein 6
VPAPCAAPQPAAPLPAGASSSPPLALLPLAHGIAYCADLLTPPEAAALTALIDALPPAQWAALPRRRLLNLGGVPHPSGTWAEPLPPGLLGVLSPRLAALGVFSAAEPAQQVLLNEYLRGAGIGAHRDGPLFQPRVAIVSLGGDAVLRFARERGGAPCASVALRANSLVVFEGEAYSALHHYIEDAAADAVDGTVLNAAAAGVAVGAVLQRPPRRLSLTLRRLARVERWLAAGEVLPEDALEEQARRRAWWLQSISEKD